MNIEPPPFPMNMNHFDRIMMPCRVLATADPLRGAGAAWQFVKADVETVGEIGQPAADCLWIDIGNSGAISLAALQRCGLPVVVAFGIDDSSTGNAMALLDAADGYVLPDDSDTIVAAVLTAAIANAGGAPSLRVGELSDGAARTMQALSKEASRIAEQLSVLAAQEAANIQPVRGIDATLVRRLIKLRRDRERFFPAEIFADPAWDMLLDLTAARLEDKKVPVSSLCIAAAVPTTTALRWIRSLTDAGLLVRRVDTLDARRSHVELSDSAASAMLGYLRLFGDQFSLR